ncbi:MAG: Ig-like domain-containing protein, partial [Candidatus Dormibacterales bacterium]
RLLAAGAAICALLPLTACGGDPPAIVDYTPQRGSIDVPTSVPIRITFDHDVDQASVQSRFHLVPATTGTVRWLSGRELVFDHATLATNTSYDIVLEAGYRDNAGNVYPLRHHWSFVTESPPTLTGSTPATTQSDFDPSAFLTLDFTREMNATASGARSRCRPRSRSTCSWIQRTGAAPM